MIEEPAALTIKKNRNRPTQEQIDKFNGVQSSIVVDALMGGGALASNIKPIGDDRNISCVAAGPALTAGSGPADILAVVAAMKFIQPGGIVVSGFDAFQGCAAAGDRVIGLMKNNGAAGFVTDGPVRDYQGIVDVGLPVWCAGLTPGSPFSKGPGSVGMPVQIAGQEVETCDMIIADRDGVVVVPFEKIDATLDMLDLVKASETQLDAEVAKGLKVSPSVEELLPSDQVKFVD